MGKEIWRKNFEITRTHLQMATPALYDMMTLQTPTVGKNIVTEGLWIQKGYDNTGTHFKISELRCLIDKTMEVIIKNPKKINNVHEKALKYNKDLFDFSKDLLKKDLRPLTNNQLAGIYNKFAKIFIKSHGWALPTTWFLDSDGEDFSKYVFNKVKEKIVQENSSLNPAEAFSTLTTPIKPSLAIIEEIESLKILDLINKSQKAKKIFLNKNGVNLEGLETKILRKINSHYKKWRWQSYTYMGPAYNIDYYLEVWSGLLKQKINIKKELSRLINQSKEIKQEKNNLIKKLHIGADLKSILKIAADIIYLKSYRKDAWFFTCYAMEGLYKEIGKRLNLSLNQVWFMAWEEVVPALKKGIFPVEILNQRMKSCVYHQKGNKTYIYTGNKAKQFLSKINIEKVKEVKNIDELKGTCAYPGKVKGIVKIINQVEEIGKMNKGEIMLAHTTYPALVPAMKKAAAIVTDDGGVTCHAAIVSRELKIPAVVGTKIITKILHDGDKVEVDATSGIIKKIK